MHRYTRILAISLALGAPLLMPLAVRAEGTENDRLQALPDIAAEFDRLKTRAENKIKVTLVSASEVDTAQAQTVTRALEKTLGRQVDLALEVDPTLLGGAVVRAEDMVIDGSVRSRLRRLAETLVD